MQKGCRKAGTELSISDQWSEVNLIFAFFAGAIIYALLFKAQTPVLPYPQAENQAD